MIPNGSFWTSIDWPPPEAAQTTQTQHLGTLNHFFRQHCVNPVCAQHWPKPPACPLDHSGMGCWAILTKTSPGPTPLPQGSYPLTAKERVPDAPLNHLIQDLQLPDSEMPTFPESGNLRAAGDPETPFLPLRPLRRKALASGTTFALLRTAATFHPGKAGLPACNLTFSAVAKNVRWTDLELLPGEDLGGKTKSTLPR